MRNLKKILALALALIMSLSLMVTASAAKTEFGDQESINEKYELAIEVLNQLGVLKGDDRDGDGKNEFRPTDTITRGEVAAIIYRVFTGKTDVSTDGHGIYTAADGEFADVKGHWAEGYMVYCYQGGYIKGWPGVGGVVLNPGGNITGYEVLTMILRAVGYDKKENEFTGLNWKLNVSTTATEKGVLANYQGTDLGAAATRQEVAELIFRAILLPKVEYSLVTNSYTVPDENNTIASNPLGMEKIEGVVVANEWANIKEDGTKVLGADKTDLLLADGTTTRLDIDTDITDIGESRIAYVQGSKVLAPLQDSGKNTVNDYRDQEVAGLGIAVSKLASVSLDNDDTDRFLNFEHGTEAKSPYRLEYSISFMTDDDLDWFETKYGIIDLAANAKKENADNNRSSINELRDSTAATYYGVPTTGLKTGRTFTRTIPAGEVITDLDRAIMEGIFKSAGSFDETHPDFEKLTADRPNSTIAGYVYAGTRTAPNNLDDVDLSDNGLTYAAFLDAYVNDGGTVPYTTSSNGGWLKIVDNDNDGVAEYVFLTRYHLAEIVDYNERTGAYIYSDDLNDLGLTHKCRDGYTPAVGDFVLWAKIDGLAVIQKVEPEIAVFEKYDWRTETITTTDGAKTYYQSGTDVTNGTEYADDISKADYGVEYELFLDAFGHIRAYRPVDNTKHYALLTELYTNGRQNNETITSRTATVELYYRDADGKTVGDEYLVDNYNRGENPFVGPTMVGIKNDPNLTHQLQRAMAHLDLDAIAPSWSNSKIWGIKTNESITGTGHATKASADMTYGTFTAVTDHGDEFDYDTTPSGSETNDRSDKGSSNSTLQFTYSNVAEYKLNDDGSVDIYSAAKYATEKGEQLYYWDGTVVAYSAWKTYAEASARGADKLNLKIGGSRLTEDDWYDAYLAWYKDNAGSGLDADTRIANTRTALQLCLVPVYAEDYVQLAIEKVEHGKRFYTIDALYGANYDAVANDHVNAVEDTIFFIYTPDGSVYSYEGYDSLPDIKANEIHAMYAVAQTATNSGTNEDYWVADVIVIETNKTLALYSHMILNYNDNWNSGRRSTERHELDAIDCTTGEKITVTVDEKWGRRIPAGFYVLENPEVVDEETGELYATGAVAIEELFDVSGAYDTVAESGYNDFNIYAGQLQRATLLTKRDSYIEVWETWDDIALDKGNKDAHTNDWDTVDPDIPWYSIFAQGDSNYKNNIYDCEKLNSADYSGTTANSHELIWVTNIYKEIIFVVDTTFISPNYTAKNWQRAPFLNDRNNAKDGGDELTALDDDLYNAIMDEQTYKARGGGGTYTITVYEPDGETQVGKIVKATKGTSYTLELADYITALTDKYTISGVTKVALVSASGTDLIGSKATVVGTNKAVYLDETINGDIMVVLAGTGKSLSVIAKYDTSANFDDIPNNLTLDGQKGTNTTQVAFTSAKYGDPGVISFTLQATHTYKQVTVTDEDGNVVDVTDEVVATAAPVYTVTIGPLTGDVEVNITTEKIPVTHDISADEDYTSAYYAMGITGFNTVVDGKKITFKWSASDFNEKLTTGAGKVNAAKMVPPSKSPNYLFVGLHFDNFTAAAKIDISLVTSTGQTWEDPGNGTNTLSACTNGGGHWWLNVTTEGTAEVDSGSGVNGMIYNSFTPKTRTYTITVTEGSVSETYTVVMEITD